MDGDAPEGLPAEVEVSEEEQNLLDIAKTIKVEDVDDLTAFGEAPKAPPEFFVHYPKGDKILRMKIVCQYPDDDMHWFGARFMDAMREAKTPVYDGDSKEPTFPHRGKEFKLLREHCIVSPKWLKNPEAFVKLPVTMQAEIHRKLQLAVGMDGDFFGDMAEFSMTKSSVARLSELGKRSASSRTRSVPAAPGSKSSPTTSSSKPKDDSTEPASSGTTSS